MAERLHLDLLLQQRVGWGQWLLQPLSAREAQGLVETLILLAVAALFPLAPPMAAQAGLLAYLEMVALESKELFLFLAHPIILEAEAPLPQELDFLSYQRRWCLTHLWTLSEQVLEVQF
jgi:hypothetical protein